MLHEMDEGIQEPFLHFLAKHSRLPDGYVMLCNPSDAKDLDNFVRAIQAYRCTHKSIPNSMVCEGITFVESDDVTPGTVRVQFMPETKRPWWKLQDNG